MLRRSILPGLLLLVVVFFSSAGSAGGAELQFQVVSNQISLQIGEVAAENAVLNAGSIKQGNSLFTPFSFQITNDSEWDQAVKILATVDSAGNGQGVTLQPQASTMSPASGYFALLYYVGETQPAQFVVTKSLDGTEKEIISSLAQGVSSTVWMQLILPADAGIGNYTAPLTLTGQFVGQ